MPDSEPDNYSLEDMMKRLRSQGQGSGEGEERLVTREDGTQVIKVKKRKRRTRQPHKEEEMKRRKRSLVVAALVSVVVVGLALGLFGWILYLNGSGYRDKVVAKIEAATGAKVEMRSFRATPVSAAADQVVLNWPESSPTARLRVNGLRGDLMVSSHLTGKWKGERMQAGSGELVFRKTAAPTESADEQDREELSFLAPMSVARLRVVFGDGERAAMVAQEVRASMTIPDPAIPSANIILDGGKVRIGTWGVFEIDSGAFSLDSSGVGLGNLRLIPELAPNARIRLSGDTYPDLAVGGGVSTFGMNVDSAPSALLFGARMGALIDGVFDSDETGQPARCEVDLSDLESLKIGGALKSSRTTSLKLFKLQMFGVLGEAMDNPRFTQPGFEKPSSLRFERLAKEVRLSELNLDSDGMMRIQGEMAEVSGKLEGRLRVGIPDLIVTASPSRAIPLVFRESQDGYRWTTVQLSGTSSAPKDDLESQLKRAFEGSSPSVGGARGLDDEFEDLTTPE